MSGEIIEDHANYMIISKAIDYLISHQTNQPSLNELANFCNLSEFHFQRIFTNWAGISPKLFLSFLTKENAKKKLREFSVLQTSIENGLSGSSRLHDLFITHESVTPGEYKTWGKGLEIAYGIHSCPFGFCFIAVTKRGLCKLAFFDQLIQSNNYINELVNDWQFADIHENSSKSQSYFNQIFGEVSEQQKPLHILLKGTPFRLQVWQALLAIPEGYLATYSQIAKSINNTDAVRAVASAIANNPIAYLIPCHRVIRNTGLINEYRWGKNRKAMMIGLEQAML